MGTTQHTPGPWKAIIDDTGGRWSGWPLCVEAVNETDKVIVRTGGHYPYEWDTATSQDEAVANARLIAAAPELFAALQDLLTYDRVERPAFRSMPVGAPNSGARIQQDKLIALEDAALAALAKAKAA